MTRIGLSTGRNDSQQCRSDCRMESLPIFRRILHYLRSRHKSHKVGTYVTIDPSRVE